MNTPAVAIAAAFACGILLGMSNSFSCYRTSRQFLLMMVAAGGAVCVGACAGIAGPLVDGRSGLLAAWVGLGVFAGCVAVGGRRNSGANVAAVVWKVAD
jgi:hypothetical protein